MKATRATHQLERREEAQHSYGVRSIKHLGLELDLQAFNNFRDVPGHIIVILLRAVGQAILLVVQVFLDICADRFNEG